MGDLREIFGDPAGDTGPDRHDFGVAGQIGIWGIGFWSPELIRGPTATASVSRRGPARPDGKRKSHDSPAAQPGRPRPGHHRDRDRGTGRAGAMADGGRPLWGATVLQDLAGMLGIYAFTWFTGRVGRRPAFAVAYLIGLGATVFVFGRSWRGR